MWSTLVYLHFKYLYLVKSTYATYVMASRLNSLGLAGRQGRALD